MGLSQPLALLGLASLPLIWWLHRRRGERRTVRLAAYYLLPRGISQRGGPARAWRERLHLLLRLSLGSILTLALAGPWVKDAGLERAVVVVPHGLAYALPAPDGRSRHAHALERAAALLAELDPERALVLFAGDLPSAASSWLAPEAAVAAAREQGPRLGGIDLEAALREARRLAGGPAGVFVIDAPAAPPRDNRTVLWVRARAHGGEPERATLAVRLRSRGAGGPAQLRLDTSQGPLTVASVMLPADGEETFTVSYRGAGGTALRARLLGEDAFAPDDEAWTRLPELSPRRTGLRGPASPELERALRSLPLLAVERVADAGPPPEALDLIVAVGPAPPPSPQPEGASREPLRVWVAGGAPAAAASPAQAEPPPLRLVAGERRAGLLALRGLRAPVSPLPQPPPDAEVLVWSGAEPAAWRSERGPLNLALGFDPGRAGLAGSALHAVLWQDLLVPLLQPPLGGCRAMAVGSPLEEGALDRPGVYAGPGGGCLLAELPDPERALRRAHERATAPPEQGPPRQRPVTGPLALLALGLLLLDPILAAPRRRPRGAEVAP